MAARPAATQQLAGYLARAKSVRASWFEYDLPTSRIAERPVCGERSSSRLLVAKRSSPTQENEASASTSGQVLHRHFHDLPSFLPRDSRLVMNNSRVIPARLAMRKVSGGRAEVLLLSPICGADPNPILQQSIESSPPWKCFIGGRRVRKGDLLFCEAGSVKMRAEVLSRNGSAAEVRFSGDDNTSGLSLSQALHSLGETPLPPYIKRAADPRDVRSYQTVYAENAGSVAAPTAGLHMTPAILEDLAESGVNTSTITLHVGAGTFAQLGGPTAGDHRMHEEHFSIETSTLRSLILDIERKRPVIALVRSSA
jgi:S-adenosylmethionine:tRNA ribosyltransferase-isomerase